MGPLPLEVEALSKAFRPSRFSPGARRRGPHQALDAVSFRIEPGEVYGIIGANGSGKSTLIRILSTLLLADSGSVRVFGHDPQRDSAAVRPLINRVSADPSFFRAMSAMENLKFFGRVYGLPAGRIRSECEQILGRLHLEAGKAREPMSNLSRGQQQKVAVARAFLSRPRLLLLDEPTTGLDPRSKRDVQRFVREVQADDGVSVLLTTHDMQEAELLCDRIGFLSGGRLVAEGTPLELRKEVAGDRSLEEVDMETVFMELTGRDLDDDEDADR